MRPSASFPFVGLFLALTFSGCSSNSFHNPTNAQFGGKVMGGEQAITGATIQLYAVGASTTGGSSTPLISATVTTSDGSGLANANANAGNNFNTLPAGYFTITGDYACLSASTQVYLTASGGNPGLAAGTNNSTIQQLVALGACGQLSSSTQVIMNEATTVGSIAALYPYMTAYNAVGSTAGNKDYLGQEFSVATEYMNSSLGDLPGPNLPSGFYASENEVNTIANVLFTCVNSTGATPGDGSNCGSLLLAAKPSAGTSPTDTVSLVLDLLNNPTNNVTGIYNYISPTPPFVPYDITAPSDFTLPILALPQTPLASPVSGNYAASQTVTLASQTAGATLYYTTNGTTPTTTSSIYSGPITVSANQTIKAIAANRAGTSTPGSFAYTITGTAATPVISLAPGTYSTPQLFTVTSSSADASVYVTIDGSTPTSASTPVTGTLQLTKTETLKAIAIAGSLSSSVASAAYTYSPTSGIINTFAGGGTPTGDNLAATAAELSIPYGVAVDASGNLYIADSNNSRIRMVSAATGIITTIAGTGTPGYSAAQDGGPATSAQLTAPSGVAVDSSGNLYIADRNNQRIRKVNLASGIITTVAGTGTSGYVAAQDGGPATSAELFSPNAVAVDSSGNLYIADTNNQRIRKVNLATGIITTVAGTGTAGYVSTQDGNAATSAELNYPYGIAVDSSGNLYVGDSINNRVRKITASTGIITTIAGTGTAGYVSGEDGNPATSAELNGPFGVAVDPGGNLYILEYNGQRVRKITAATGIITTVAGTGTPGYAAAQDGGPATSAQINNAWSVAVDPSGNLYIADTFNERIRKVTASTGIITTVAGTGTTGYITLQDGTAATNAQLNQPAATAMDSSGNLYIVEQGNNRVRKVAAATGIITTVAGTGTPGYVSGEDGNAATSAELFYPYGVAVDSSGNIYIADTANSRIRKVTVATGIITTVAGTGTNGYVAAQDGGPATSAELNDPYGVAVDSSGNIYIADTGNSRIRKVTASTGKISTVAGNGTAGYVATQDNGPATSAELYSPAGVAIDASGNLFIADTTNQRIRKVTAATQYITTVAGTGTGGYVAAQDGNPATSAEIYNPYSVAVDASGNFYIADYSNARVRKVTVATGNISTVAGTGTGGYVAAQDGGPATSAELNNPIGVTIDSSGNLYIADYHNNRIRVVYP